MTTIYRSESIQRAALKDNGFWFSPIVNYVGKYPSLETGFLGLAASWKKKSNNKHTLFKSTR